MTSFIYQGHHFRCPTGSLPFLLAVLMKAAGGQQVVKTRLILGGVKNVNN